MMQVYIMMDIDGNVAYQDADGNEVDPVSFEDSAGVEIVCSSTCSSDIEIPYSTPVTLPQRFWWRIRLMFWSIVNYVTRR